MWGWEGWYVLSIVGIGFALLFFDKCPADFVMVLALAACMISGVVTTEQGLVGFSSPAVLSVAVLYVVAEGVSATGALDHVMGKALGLPKFTFVAQLRLMVPVAIVSAFLNNTPVVAVLIQIVSSWGRKIGVPKSQLMIPLSFASILGGTCTLIGTSTNLVIAGKAAEGQGIAMGLFDMSVIGVPVLLTGLTYIIIFAPLLLPGKKKSSALASESESACGRASENFTVGCSVRHNSPACGKTVADAGLRGLDGLYLTSVQRGAKVVNAVGPDFMINESDILFFTGLVDEFPALCARMNFTAVTTSNEDEILNTQRDGDEGEDGRTGEGSPLLEPHHKTPMSLRHGRVRTRTFDGRLSRVIVADGGSLVGKTPREASFRATYAASILSISRAGVKLEGRLGRIVLEIGDILLVDMGDRFDWDAPATDRDLKPLVSDDAAAVRMAERSSNLGESGEMQEAVEREFLIPMKVAAGSKLRGLSRPLSGLTIEAAGLRGLPGLFLVAIERSSGVVEHAVGPDATLYVDDCLWFAGDRTAIGTLRRIPGLESADNQLKKLKADKTTRRLVEVVISLRSEMIGKTVRETRFRTRFDAAIVAVHRHGARVVEKVGKIELRAGDVLLLDTGPGFILKFRNDDNFLLVSELENSSPPRFDKFYVAFACIVLMMALHMGADIDLTVCAIVAAAGMVALGCLTPERARKAVKWDVIVTIACAFGLSNAMENSGVAEEFATVLVDLADSTNTGEVGILCAIYLATFLMSLVIANNAAALLMYPIAIGAATQQPGVSPTRALYALMFAASSSFASPFGYQTNLMVYGPGGYVFKDFVRFGLPMQFWRKLVHFNLTTHIPHISFFSYCRNDRHDRFHHARRKPFVDIVGYCGGHFCRLRCFCVSTKAWWQYCCSRAFATRIHDAC